MKTNKKVQTNYRLPESLFNELKEVSEKTQLSQTQIVKQGVEARVRQLKKVIARRRETESAPA
jgi:hypothetical protein